MQGNPNEPSDKPAHAKAATLQYRKILANDRHIALIEVAEWAFWLSSLELSRDQASNIAPFLDRRLRHARHRPPVAHDRRRIADDEYARKTLNIHERTDGYPARAIGLGTKQLHKR